MGRLTSNPDRAALVALVSAGVFLAGCDSGSRPADAGRDAGARDAGAALDAAARDAGTDDAGAPRPATEIVEIGLCDAGSLTSTTCLALEVRSPAREPLGVELRVTEPNAPARATLVVGTGGGGNAFADEASDPAVLLAQFRDAGYRIVQRRWASPGWFAGETGLYAASSAYAALLAWIDERFAGASLCAMGLSGGSIEIAFALARWDGADRLEGAVLLGGPSMSALDRVCPSVATSAWTVVECPALAAARGIACPTLYCTLQGAAGTVDSSFSDAPCSSGADPERLAAEGVVAPGARFAYPTRLAFVVGADECSGSLLPFVEAVETEASFTLVPATPHDVWATAAGRAASYAAVLETCP